jgi:hypothetical protein
VLAERLELRHIARAVSSPTAQGVKPHRHPTIAGRQRKQLELLHPFPLGVVARLQARHGFITPLLREQPGKLDRHRIGVQAAQVDFVLSCCSANHLTPQYGPLRVKGIEQSTDSIIIELFSVVHVGIQGRNIIRRSPPRHIVERPGSRQAALDHQLRHHARVQISLFSHGTQPIDDCTQTQTT